MLGVFVTSVYEKNVGLAMEACYFHMEKCDLAFATMVRFMIK
jgi:hypothetical protein